AVRVDKRDAPKLIALHVADAVVKREALVDERVIGAQQLEHAAILEKNARDEELELLLEALAEVVIEFRKHDRIGIDLRDAAHVEPLEREVRDERARLRVFQHPPHLPREHAGLRKAPLLGKLEQLVVRDAAPQE